MKITLIELDPWCSTVTHQSVLTLTLDFFLSFEVATMQQTDRAAHKLKPRSFHKSTHLWVHSVDFHPSVNCAWQGVIIVTNKVALPSDFQTIENVVENMENINSNNIETSWLPQSKSYLKITSILFFIKNTNVSILEDFVEMAIKSNYIFNNLSLASCFKTIGYQSISKIWYGNCLDWYIEHSKWV